jgi:hypothetical protein
LQRVVDNIESDGSLATRSFIVNRLLLVGSKVVLGRSVVDLAECSLLRHVDEFSYE